MLTKEGRFISAQDYRYNAPKVPLPQNLSPLTQSRDKRHSFAQFHAT